MFDFCSTSQQIPSQVGCFEFVLSQTDIALLFFSFFHNIFFFKSPQSYWGADRQMHDAVVKNHFNIIIFFYFIQPLHHSQPKQYGEIKE